MNALDLAVIHDAKNTLSGLLLRLEEQGHFEKEIALLLRTSSRLSNLLLWHKKQDGEMRMNIDAVSPTDLISEIQSEFSHTFPNISINVDAQTAPAFWFYDDNYIRLALSNAVHNACSFAKSEVSIAVVAVENMLLFRVEDDGEGYSESLLNAFEKHHAIETSHRGTGLGLLLANTIAQMHQSKGRHGGVILRNQNGAVFEMLLP
jgi:K+-sensing histidine kinase KdpD